MTIRVDETLYETLKPMVEQQTLGTFLSDFARALGSQPVYTRLELDAGYRAMAADEEYEQGAMEWCNGLMGGVSDETR
jgi:hypothetical protein